MFTLDNPSSFYHCCCEAVVNLWSLSRRTTDFYRKYTVERTIGQFTVVGEWGASGPAMKLVVGIHRGDDLLASAYTITRRPPSWAKFFDSDEENMAAFITLS